MESKHSLDTVVTMVLLTVITFVMLFSMDHDTTANLIKGIVLLGALFFFAGILIVRGNITFSKNKDNLRKS